MRQHLGNPSFERFLHLSTGTLLQSVLNLRGAKYGGEVIVKGIIHQSKICNTCSFEFKLINQLAKQNDPE